MSLISEIDSRRAKHGIRQAVLCKQARVHPTTYSALKSRRRGAHSRTLEKLAAALDALIERGAR
ncbi:helix-turn-helix transcriptional regulator [Mesorhizobium sp. Z1-4]|uniref:helix-turn-helix domain-containing protein n=1 Tax=Mesorhizobium sp. Z1-4 TaxID=2448478 RepID=UPI00197E9DB6|nr:helix-turn-helix transcriptional regulator [Mesorhizobium sp. Z1-4]